MQFSIELNVAFFFFGFSLFKKIPSTFRKRVSPTVLNFTVAMASIVTLYRTQILAIVDKSKCNIPREKWVCYNEPRLTCWLHLLAFRLNITRSINMDIIYLLVKLDYLTFQTLRGDTSSSSALLTSYGSFKLSQNIKSFKDLTIETT